MIEELNKLFKIINNNIIGIIIGLTIALIIILILK